MSGAMIPAASSIDFPDEFDGDPDEGEFDLGEECGRWGSDGRPGLGRHCTKAGSEFCDWDCPHNRGDGT